MNVIGVESRSDLVDVAVDESLGPCHDGLGLLGSRRHGFEEERGGGRRGEGVKYDQMRPRASRCGVRGGTSRRRRRKGGWELFDAAALTRRQPSWYAMCQSLGRELTVVLV